MRYFIGADLGTSAIKLILSDTAGRSVRSVSKTYGISYPRPNWSEQSPADWWNAFSEGVRELCRDIEGEVCALAVAGQMHGLVILDENDEVIRPAILWNDGRTDEETRYLNEEIGKERLNALTANVAYAGFTAPKLLWLKKNEPEAFGKISKIMLPKDYLNYRLTGVHATDYSDASGTLLFDVGSRKWSSEMMQICSVRPSQMPKLLESFSPIGKILPDVARELGLCKDVTVMAGAADNAAAALGAECEYAPNCNLSLGTSGTVFVCSEEFTPLENNALHVFCHANGGYNLLGCMLSAASCNSWFCEKVLETSDYDAISKKITDGMLGSCDLFFLPYLMGERSPINDTDASGAFVGLRPWMTGANMLLAVMEGVAFALRDSMEIARSIGVNVSSCTVTGGGTKSNLWMKILSCILNMDLYVPEEEGPALGAVKLAMVGSGEYATLTDCPSCTVAQRIRPDARLSALYEKQYEKYKSIYPALKNVYKIINE